ncbi:NAD(P)H-hydrate dehydratase [Ramlibacter henchirensis]|uniref:ADP-dependent (S)-NAD(P)H-hydrate dehydratase n=1 Tax=Ramlibacter henchirensis TaxID=204072 RepID=A0A4Z0C6M6_9BURK|nr:NAD(P)H-hydrate dehydratase [Ramlibacter henchirensis]TFZ07283.1 NAD(P)H-hydrate dehydratase [Ramlibacter henchirensis]
MDADNRPQRIDPQALRRWPLPPLSEEADKEERGRIVVVAGSREIPGAAVLAATAALRVGAGKLVIATGRSVAAQMAFAVPEARVIALPETPGGGFEAGGAQLLEQCIVAAHAVVIGPGLMDADATCAFMQRLMPMLRDRAVVLDALAMDCVSAIGRFPQPVLLTPHAGEMAHLTKADKDEVLADPVAAAVRAARSWNAVVAVKGPTTAIAAPDGRTWLHEGGNCGLATSGSGDTLAGAIGGLAARGAPLEQACAWGVVVHAQAGERLADRLGPVGYLAREIAQEMVAVLRTLDEGAGVTPPPHAPTGR